MFPDTTIFYSATVAKDTPRIQGNRKVSIVVVVVGVAVVAVVVVVVVVVLVVVVVFR